MKNKFSPPKINFLSIFMVAFFLFVAIIIYKKPNSNIFVSYLILFFFAYNIIIYDWTTLLIFEDKLEFKNILIFWRIRKFFYKNDVVKIELLCRSKGFHTIKVVSKTGKYQFPFSATSKTFCKISTILEQQGYIVRNDFK